MARFSDRIKKILTRDCELSERELNYTSKKEALEAILEYEGIIGYTDFLIDMIEEIYDVSLES